MHLEPRTGAAGLGRVFDQVEQRADQGVAVTQQFALVAVALPAHIGVLHMGGGRRLQRLHQAGRRDAVGQRQFAAGKHQHVAHLVLQLMQALLEASGKTLVGVGGQLLISQMTGVDQRRRQRRADLMRQRSDHPTQRRQALMARQLVLQVTGFSQVVEQHQLTGLRVQGASGDGQAAPILEGDFMAVIFTRREAAADDMAPQFALQRQSEQVAGGRVGFAHTALVVDDDHTARQQIEQVLQTVGQALFLGQLFHALGTDHRQLALEFGDPRFQQAVGVGQLAGHLTEQRERLLKAMPAELFGGRDRPLEFRGRR